MEKATERNFKKEVENIKEFLTERANILRFSGIEQAAKLPKNTLLNIMSTDRMLPVKHLNNLIDFIQTLGYVPLFDWSWMEYEVDGDCVFVIEKDGKKHNIKKESLEECVVEFQKNYQDWRFNSCY
jgi:hypothetical protein